jgi:hypothetical protein
LLLEGGQPLMGVVGVQVIELSVTVMVVAVTTWVASVVKYEVLEDVLDWLLCGQPLIGTREVDPVVEVEVVVVAGQPLMGPAGVKEAASKASKSWTFGGRAQT